MEYRKLGSSDLRVSAFGLGSWQTFEFIDEDAGLALLTGALERGVNFLDDARYNDRTGQAPLPSGYSEVLFGRLLRRSGAERGELVIANKLWLEFYPGQSLEDEIDGSLERMQLDYLDLAYCVPPTASLPLADYVRQVDALTKTGKLRFWGALGWSVEQLVEAHELATREGLSIPIASQPAYSLLRKSPVEDLASVRFHRECNVGIVASYTLYGGLLSGKYNAEAEALETRFTSEDVARLREKGLVEKVDLVIDIARNVGCTPAQLAMAYVLKNPQVVTVLFGAKQPWQIEENLEALEVAGRLDGHTMERLNHL